MKKCWRQKITDVVCAQTFFRRNRTKPILKAIVLEGFFRILIFYVLAVDFQRVLAIKKSLDNRQCVCHLTTTRELMTTIEELFISTITLDETSLSSTTTMLSVSSTSSALPSASSSTSSGYVFNSQSIENVAVYFGQTDATGSTTFAKQCADQNIDIVILAFVVSRNGSGSLYPGVNFGAACGGRTSLMEEEAPGLLLYPVLSWQPTLTSV